VKVTLEAPAKLTTSLRIVGVRSDGFHLIDAEMVALSLHDSIELTEAADTSVIIDNAPDITDELVTAALALVDRTASVRIDKQIPAGAGLGGGSADAAAVLRWAGWNDLESAAVLGADVAFCLAGGRARVSGIGEIVEPLPFEARTYTLYTPPLHCSTPSVYAKWDDLGGPVGENGNDLEPAALAIEPRLAAARDRIGEQTGLTPRLAGSGSTWFVEGAIDGADFKVVETVPPAL
jgi:4-diphosphocytidyl-2-C-methyl-D-erythritol kinase